MSSQTCPTLSIVLRVLRRPARSYPTKNRPALKRECHSETALGLKERYPKLEKHFIGLVFGCTELHARLYGDKLIDVAIHRSQIET
jgi:hypothetical protein